MNIKKLFKLGKPGKKTLKTALVAVIVLGATSIGLASCSRTSIYQQALDNIAEARFYMKQSNENPNAKVQLFSGMREEPYAINGTAENTRAFSVINLEPTNDTKLFDNYLELQGELRVDDGEPISITLDKNPYDRNFACDLGTLIDKSKSIVFTLTLDAQTTMTFNLANCMPDDAITWERALEVATTHLQEELKKSGKFETYVKIVHDIVKDNGSFWYIQFATQNGDNLFCVINHVGEIVG